MLVYFSLLSYASECRVSSNDTGRAPCGGKWGKGHWVSSPGEPAREGLRVTTLKEGALKQERYGNCFAEAEQSNSPRAPGRRGEGGGKEGEG